MAFSIKNFWNLRTKSLAVIGGILIALTIALFFATQGILFTSFNNVEKTVTERNVNRVSDAITDEMQSLSNYTSAYSKWDESIKFVQRGENRSFAQNANDPYVSSNVVASTFEAEGHNLFLYIDKKGKLIWGAGYDLHGAKFRPISDSLKKQFAPGSPLVKHSGPDDIKNGFVIVSEGLMYLSSQPLVDSNNQPPIEGTVATGHDFDLANINHLGDKTHLKLAVFPINDPNLPADVVAAKAAITSKAPIHTAPRDKNVIYGYKVLNDIYGKPLLVLRVEAPREIFHQGLVARNYLILSLLSIGIVFLLMAVVLLTRLYHRDQEVTELKDRFIAIASHELRTPLTSIKGGADLLSAQKLPGEAVTPIKLIQGGIVRLIHLTDELINVATIEKGHFKPVHEPVDLAEIANSACASLQPVAQSKGLKLSCRISPNLPKFYGDARLLRSAVLNLLDNAVKFTEKGGVQLTVEPQGKQMIITVADTGPGIKEQDTYMLFKKFAKVASVRESFKEGHGMGLYLTKLVAEAHGGKIEAYSPGTGSVFTISLPLDYT